MKIKNYTSSTPVARSVEFIETRLAAAGAGFITKVYDGEPKRLKGLTFQIVINGMPTIYKLPARDEYPVIK
jgi:hypothetical protein